jgi:hypothetical protein
MVLFPIPKDLDTLGLFTREDLDPTRDTSPQQAIQACFKGLRQTAQHLTRHAKNMCRLDYGKALLRMFFKKPDVALKSIMCTAAGTTTNSTLPTDLSIIKDETTCLLITTPSEVVNKIS